MSVDQEKISRVLSVLSHKIRRGILILLDEKGESSFTELMNALDIDTGKLSFHIRNLSPFIEQTENSRYKLSRVGEDAVRVIRDVESWAEVADIDRKTSELCLASYRRRIYAFLIDFGIMLPITSALLIEPFLVLFSANLTIILNIIFLALGALWIYSTLLEGFSGQSLGKKIIGLRVVKINGKKMDYEHAAVRNFGKLLLPFDLLIGYGLKDPRFKRYFDKFAGTTVTELRQQTN